MSAEQDLVRYYVFTRTWWRHNPQWPGGREPGAGTRRTQGHPRNLTYSEAQRYCRQWNETHDPGKWSRKAEFDQQ